MASVLGELLPKTQFLRLEWFQLSRKGHILRNGNSSNDKSWSVFAMEALHQYDSILMECCSYKHRYLKRGKAHFEIRKMQYIFLDSRPCCSKGSRKLIFEKNTLLHYLRQINLHIGRIELTAATIIFFISNRSSFFHSMNRHFEGYVHDQLSRVT